MPGETANAFGVGAAEPRSEFIDGVHRMLSRLWHLQGSVKPGSSLSEEMVLERISKMLEDQHKTVSLRNSDSIEFNHPLWSGGDRLKALALYDKGRIWIDCRSGATVLRYELRSLHAVVFTGFASIMFVALYGVAEEEGAMQFGAGVFAWLYGVNVLIALFRVPRLFKHALNPAEAT
ncbi:hypothetical protein G6N74_08135 [Mesorhizobium sp. CGMCC 1.15528]|uniref:Uncharacterized protein n=1 Tax=Mesorhizobium zhangyense TaxID=1776730 RepID=A0A7C9VAZ8_9HYPH|nr:hypothetical protein [Mesorhizobium zhangyense]NGN41029.1 hypothetical protein [Mesorhizobium zhangyense]